MIITLEMKWGNVVKSWNNDGLKLSVNDIEIWETLAKLTLFRYLPIRCAILASKCNRLAIIIFIDMPHHPFAKDGHSLWSDRQS